jgi:predicted DNA-binding transcriptional regulator AlpA
MPRASSKSNHTPRPNQIGSATSTAAIVARDPLPRSTAHYMRLLEVSRLTGMAPSTVRAKVRVGQFPAPRRLTPDAGVDAAGRPKGPVGWWSDDVYTYLDQVAQRNAELAALAALQPVGGRQ